MIELLPMGDRAVIVTGMIDPAAWAHELKRGPDPLFTDSFFTVPAAATVLVVCESAVVLAQLIQKLHSVDPATALARGFGTLVEIPVVYDGADLAAVARATGLRVGEVVQLHAGAAYTVAFCGFAPGFAYLRGLPRQLQLPRRRSPRASVAAGSVAVAAEFSAVYPTASPGGWHLLGRTSMTLFDSSADIPAVLQPGDSVRFLPVESMPVESMPPRVEKKQQSTRSDDGAFTVISAGVSSSIQDAGRSGHADLGVSPSGMVDPQLGAAINRFVGNPPNTPLIETCGGLVIRANRPLTIASTETIAPTALATGDVISVAGGGGRRWHYLAIRGGVDVEQVLGSSSTDTLSGLGPAPLMQGQSFGVGVEPDGPVADASPLHPVDTNVRISAGPRLDWFAPDTLATLSTGTYVVTQSSRIGARLVGPQLTRVRHTELPSEGLIRGAIQVVPSGELVMMLADHPTTGGYPVVAVVHDEDVHKVAQLEVVRFRQG
jgi:KipI family sensor histidine kinase inhibitor